jgi:NAD(P)H-flavin reductase
MVPSDKLPDEAIDFIKCADTVFIGSIYKSEAVHTARHPSHAGMNSRGGLPGFVRVMPSDRRTIIVPDYSGNKMLMSLGNIVSSGLAALTFVSFLTGDVLYVTGAGSVLTGPPALKIMARQACVLKLETSGFVFVRDAFPVRQKSGTAAEPSPYSPKIKYLNDEPEALASAGVDHKAKVVSILQLAEDIAVFKFQVIPSPDRKDLMIRPGQAIILDFMDWLGPPAYQHMADDHPQSINDDRVRTWTVSSSHESELPLWFEMTMREMKGGAVTGALFDLVRHHPRRKLGELVQVNSNVVAGVIGVAGDFFIKPGSVKLLFVAGGIGLTPFLSMFDALGNRGGNAQGDIVLALATRDPDVFLQLIEMSLAKVSSKIGIKIDLFTEQERVNIDCLKHLDNCIIHAHKGRIPLEYWPQNEKDRDVFICGPGGFGDAAVEGLKKAGVSFDRIFREGFY